jgi:hypothetical protein
VYAIINKAPDVRFTESQVAIRGIFSEAEKTVGEKPMGDDDKKSQYSGQVLPELQTTVANEFVQGCEEGQIYSGSMLLSFKTVGKNPMEDDDEKSQYSNKVLSNQVLPELQTTVANEFVQGCEEGQIYSGSMLLSFCSYVSESLRKSHQEAGKIFDDLVMAPLLDATKKSCILSGTPVPFGRLLSMVDTISIHHEQLSDGSSSAPRSGTHQQPPATVDQRLGIGGQNRTVACGVTALTPQVGLAAAVNNVNANPVAEDEEMATNDVSVNPDVNPGINTDPADDATTSPGDVS